MQQPTTTRVGAALRQVRSHRGLTLDEAARDTRIRREFLEAIEADEFDRLLGDVHVRGCLRTYASYLRVSPDKVVAAYGGEPSTAPSSAARREPVLGRPRRRDDHRLLIMVAATVLVLATAFGILSARQPAPEPAEISVDDVTEAVVVPPTVNRPITVALLAREPVTVTVTIDDGATEEYALEVGEGRSFEAERTITIELSEGGTARVTVSGKDYGFPGTAELPWRETFEYEASGATGS